MSALNASEPVMRKARTQQNKKKNNHKTSEFFISYFVHKGILHIKLSAGLLFLFPELCEWNMDLLLYAKYGCIIPHNQFI